MTDLHARGGADRSGLNEEAQRLRELEEALSSYGPAETVLKPIGDFLGRSRGRLVSVPPTQLGGRGAAFAAGATESLAPWRTPRGLGAVDNSPARGPRHLPTNHPLTGATGTGPLSPRPTGPDGPAAPKRTIQDILRAAQMRLLSSQLAGFDEQRDLVGELADLREGGLASQEQFAEETAAGREQFLAEQDAARAERFEQAAVEREQRKTDELLRQQTQLDDALRAVDVDTGAAGERLAALGIDPGDFATADMSETTAMLYSQNMSAANMVNQLDGVAIASAEFARDANDQASAAALFGIGEDLSFALQQVDQLRQQGLMDDAMAMQAIADAERQAREATDMTLSQLDVQTLQAAQAAAARQASAAAKQRKLEATAAGLGIMANIQQGGYTPTQQDLMILSEAGLGDAFLDIGTAEQDFLNDQALELFKAELSGSGSPSGPSETEMLNYLKFLDETTEGGLAALGINPTDLSPIYGLDFGGGGTSGGDSDAERVAAWAAGN